jgi:outer membrane protein TolC
MRYLTGDSRTSLGSVISASITKPLLKGSEKAIVQENLTQAERDVLYQIRTFNRYRKTFVVSVINSYYRVLQNLDNVKNAENNYENLIFANNRAAMMTKAGRMPKIQADQTEQSMLRAKDSLARAERNYKQSLDEFKIILAIPTEADITLNSSELQTLGESSIDMPDFTETEAIQTALSSRLDLANQKNYVEDAERKIKVAADNLGVSLDFTAGLNVSSPDGQKPANLQFQQGRYSAGLSLDPDLDKKSERNSYRRTLIQFNQSKRNYEAAEDNVKLDVRDAYRSLQEAATRYQIQTKALELAEERVKNTNMLLNAGRATSRDLLEAQADLLDAQNNKTSTLIDFTIEMLNFYRDVGMLTVKPDGMWRIG